MIWRNLGKKGLTKKRTFTKNTWYDLYDWLTLSLSLSETLGGVKDQFMSLFKTKEYSKPKRVKTV